MPDSKPSPKAARVPLRVAVLASGRGSNLVALLEAIRVGLVEARVALVVSDVAGAPCLEEARRRGVPAVLELPPQSGETRDAYDLRVLAALERDQPGLVVLAGYMRVVGPRLVAAYRGRMVNIHPSLLPAFKGLKAVRQTLAAGATIAGCTTHLVTGDLDGGPIVLQAALAVRPDDTEATLSRRILHLEHLLLPRTVQLFAEGRVLDENGRVRIGAGPSWLQDRRVRPAAGALYGEGF